MWYETLDGVVQEGLTGKVTSESRPERTPERTERIWSYLMKNHRRQKEQILQEGLGSSRYSKKIVRSKSIAEVIIWIWVDVPRDVYPDDTWLVYHASQWDRRLLEGFKSTIDLTCSSRFTLHFVVWRGARVKTINRLLPCLWGMVVVWNRVLRVWWVRRCVTV